MKMRNLARTLFVFLIAVSILCVTALAFPAAVTVSDSLSDTSKIDSSAELLETGEYALPPVLASIIWQIDLYLELSTLELNIYFIVFTEMLN